MTSAAIVLILFSAVLHAGWNLISKSGKPSSLFFLIINVSTILLWMPFLFANLAGIILIPLKFWYLLLATGFFQTLYYSGLAQAYHHGDISLVYPLIRSIPVVLVPLVCHILNIGEALSDMALFGMLLIGIGCILIPVKSFKTWHFRDYWGPAMFWVIPGALGTVGYTIIDSEAIKLLNENSFSLPVSIIYSGLLNIAIFPWLLSVVICITGWKGIIEYRGKKILTPIAAGVALTLSYLLVLASMKLVSNVSYVAGFRQLSIPLGLFFGAIFLKEKIYLPRLLGSAIIVTGLVMTAVF